MAECLMRWLLLAQGYSFYWNTFSLDGPNGIACHWHDFFSKETFFQGVNMVGVTHHLDWYYFISYLKYWILEDTKTLVDILMLMTSPYCHLQPRCTASRPLGCSNKIMRPYTLRCGRVRGSLANHSYATLATKVCRHEHHIKCLEDLG